MVTKEQYIGWKRGDVGKLFDMELNATVEQLLSEMANRPQCLRDRDMWIRGAMWAISEMNAWVPELTPEMEMPDE